MKLEVNGRAYDLEVDPHTSLLDLLRERLSITGPKKGCNQGGCGACTVIRDGERVLGCLTLALQCDGSSVVTVEGLAGPDGLHPLQQSFIDHDGLQCGYCTPGQLCSALAMASEVSRGAPSRVTPGLDPPQVRLSADEIRERMSGNLCRCGAYNGIVAAIAEVYGDERGRAAEQAPST